MKISVVIPVKNGADTLGLCLQKIREQTIGDIEIIVLDSMSTDSSTQIAASFGAIMIEVPDGTFNHGLTRNVGVQHATGELIYLTVQDAWAGANDMLEKMAAHFSDPSVMGVVGHQAVPHERDKNPFYWYRPISKPSVTIRKLADKDAFMKMPQREQQSLVAWDNVVSMYRKTALTELPFVQTELAEDWVWSFHALLKGWKLLHDSSIVVYHYHHQTYRYLFSLIYTNHYHLYKFFKYKPSLPSVLIPMIRISYHLLKNKELVFREKMYWIMHNASGRLANLFSTIDFLARLKTGGAHSIAKGYYKYCKTIPQGKQKNR